MKTILNVLCSIAFVVLMVLFFPFYALEAIKEKWQILKTFFACSPETSDCWNMREQEETADVQNI